MTQDVDPRLARRRRQVQEASARRRLRWTVGLLIVALVAGLVVALFQSSWFSVADITVEGAERSAVDSILAESGITEGISIVSVRAGDVEDKLREDPWIAEAQVRAVWPSSIEVVVVEYLPAAKIKNGAGWLVSSSQGTVLARGEDLVDPFVGIEVGDLQPGAVIEDLDVLGALEFIGSLPIELKEGLAIKHEANELVATVAGHQIVLGSSRDMAQKAVTLAVLLEQGVPDGASINLVSPLRPAVTDPQPVVEGLEEVTSETTVSSYGLG
ncbi:MAG: FtsQ-type POTRA domain-containing protein [Acidimicrobiia bacterium]|nr:FtsQ-type POTRA domain-containing protein [Acidimicrobiia bacterium]